MRRTGAEASGRLVLDTSAYSRLRQWDPEVERRVGTAAAILVPAIVVGELEAAFASGTRRQANLDLLEEFLGAPFVSVVPVTRAIAARYGSLWADLRRSDIPMGINGIWTAATALDADADLVTFDADFTRVPGLGATVLSAG